MSIVPLKYQISASDQSGFLRGFCFPLLLYCTPYSLSALLSTLSSQLPPTPTSICIAAAALASTTPFLPSSRAQFQQPRPPWKPRKKPSFISMSTPDTPSFSQSTHISSPHFPQTLKLPSLHNPPPLLPPPISDATDHNYPGNADNISNLQVISNGFPTNLTSESGGRVFIRDPPWISALFMKNLLFRSKKSSGVKLEFQEMERRKYYLLRRRQVKAETEAWQNMVEEYRELEREMCERKLAPNLPYFKKLMLGWFQPFREAIEKEQNLRRSLKNKAAFAPFIDALPADKIAIIVMHKIMSLLMVGGKEDRSVRVVEAAVQIGVAIEQEIRIQNFFKKEKNDKGREVVAEGEEDQSKEVANLRQRVKRLIKRNRVNEVQKLLRSEEFESWGRDTQAKLGCCLIELLTQSAYVQPPIDQTADCPPEVRPAFRHVFKIAAREPG